MDTLAGGLEAILRGAEDRASSAESTLERRLALPMVERFALQWRELQSLARVLETAGGSAG